MKLYLTPGSCSTGIHILLEEIGIAFEAYLVNLLAGDHQKPDFLILNPKASIPILVRDDGSVLTEFPAIAHWLARAYPKAKLLPTDLESEVRAIEIMSYVVGTIHGQGFTRIFTTDRFTPNAADYDAVKARGQEIVCEGFTILNQQLAGKKYLLEHFSIADAALFYVEFWATRINIELPAHCLAHYQQMLTRPAVQQVLREEGYRC
ncbi:glutathione S-transferase family protein [Beggiatoa leptomitoformis]|uniref:Glutathione S-transferase n=1 Tax=Beggiatoa leptomitoformis TaxID=288004 RepID=A0A2N9YEH4_9GAMM|nr:glutathione S-transferase N-terminal domain-containing protein [Beggiatoa leptomitoformis]ALG68740.1 glutathione S-transferase [Beggiatoa leptomitoformis]AUI68901.1 glutathione S-transferase [Beggiatoa leptomitoformis]